MDRLSKLMFVAMVLANQGLCLAHAHHDDLSGSGRLHLHLGGHAGLNGNAGHPNHAHGAHRHGEETQQETTVDSPFRGHDADAVYCNEQLATTSRDAADDLPAKVAMGCAFQKCITKFGCLRLTRSRYEPSSFLGSSDCPIYLRELSLRL